MCIAFIPDLRSYRIWDSFGNICIFMFLEAKKIHFRCAVYVVVWVDQPSGMYRVCGVRSVAPGDHHRCDSKKKEFMAAMGIWRVAVNVYDR